MDGGEIYGTNGYGGVYIFYGIFKKNPGGVIYGYHTSGKSNSNSYANGNAICVERASVIMYRNDDVKKSETLAVTVDNSGNVVAGSKIGNWQ